MAFEDKSLNEFIKKILQIQQERQENKLSPEDLLDIADRMGINPEEIRAALEANIQRGQGYIKYQNWQDAKEEFEQARVLSPQNPEILYNLALAEAGLFKDTGDDNCRKRAIEYAQESLEFEPNNERAFKLISEIKRENRKIVYERPKSELVKKKKSRGIAVFAMIVVLLIGFGTFVTIRKTNKGGKQTSFNFQNVLGNESYKFSRDNAFEDFKSFYGNKGPVVWITYYWQEVRNGSVYRDDFVDIIDPLNNRLLKTILIEDDREISKRALWGDLQFDGINAFRINEEDAVIEVRDIYSGDVVLNNLELEKKFEELKSGIGKLKKEDDGLLITTKSGEEYFYNPVERTLIEENRKKQIISDYEQMKSWIYRYEWFNLRDGNKSKLAVERKLSNPFQRVQTNFYDRDLKSFVESYSHQRDKGKSNRDEKISFREDRVYFNPHLLYADSSICVLSHQSEIGKKAKNIITCINSDGKNLWEFKKSSSVLLNNLEENPVLEAMKFQNTIVFLKRYAKVSKTESKNVACAIDLATGKVLWEFSFK